MSKAVEIAVNINCELGESPVWDVKRNCLHFVDIISAKVYSYYPKTGEVNTIEAPGMVGAIAPAQEDKFLAAVDDGLYLVDIDNGEWTFLVHPEAHLPENRFNDGKCDGAGRFWIGSLHVEEKAHEGALYVLDKDLSHTTVLEGTTVSNGMEWDESNGWYYHIDSEEKCVKKYLYEPEKPGISEAERVIVFGEDEGVPDGMTMDTQGMLWIAHFGGGCVTRRDPSTGDILLKIDLPVDQVTSCTFGGEDLGDLYITTAAKELSDEELGAQPHAGSTFVVRDMGYTGHPPKRFGK